MLIKPEPTSAVNNTPFATACGECGGGDRLLLLHVRHNRTFRRLCTTCVLRLHPQSFCPTCFQVHPPHPTNDPVLTCYKCHSVSHSHCVSGAPISPPNPYTCPLCVDPSARVFRLRTAKEANVDVGESLSVKGEEYRVMDRDSAKKLLAAAKIALATMNTAAMAARAEAERRAKEAAFTRKRAREALEHVAHLVVKEKQRKKEATLSASVEVAGPVLSGRGGNAGYMSGGFSGTKLKRENSVNVGGNRNGVLAIGGAAATVMEEKVNTSGNMDRVDNSNQVLAALNAVELRENEKSGGVVTPQSALSIVKVDDDQVLMDVDESNGDDVGNLVLADIETDAVKDLDVGQERRDDLSDEVVLVQAVANQTPSNSAEPHANPGTL